jgi:TPP-dependent pyruvate/acetoin dehydrogenase alpha subunit
MREEILAEVDAAVAFAERSPEPGPHALLEDVFI